MDIDIKTLALFYFIANLMNNGLMFIIWRMYRKHYRGLSFLLADMSLQTVASLFLLLRGLIPDFASVFVTNLFSATGLLLILKGLERFFDHEKKRVYNYILISIFMCAVVYFSLIDNNLLVRNICLSTMIILLNGQSSFLLFRDVKPKFQSIARFTASTLLAYCIFSLLRITAYFFFPQQNNEFFTSGIVNSISMIAYSSLNILIMAGLIMMVSRRLLSDVQTEKDKYISAFQSSPYALLLTRIADGRILEVNEGFVTITGYRPEEALGKTTLELGLWADPADRTDFVSALTNGREVRDQEKKIRIKSGEIITGLLSASQIAAFGEDCILTSVSDITEMIRIKERLEIMALHDILTGLPNRQLFYDRASVAILHAKREKDQLAIVSLDVDRLKSINDQWGHAAGDHVLITIGNRLSSLLRKGDTISRFGGDEFLILLNRINRPEDARAIADKIMDGISEPIKVGSDDITVTVSLGIALYPEDGSEIGELIRKSDEAMYLIKMHGRNGYKFYRDIIR